MHGKFSGNELAYVTRALDSEDKSNKTTPWTQRLEAAVAKEVGASHAIAHNSGTSALHSSLAAAGVGPGDEVISPAITVVMDSFATLYLGAVPVFAEVDTATHNIDPEDVRRKITPRTKAIITVSLHGLPADVAPIMAMAEDRGITVIEDCAQTMLGLYPMPDGSTRISGTIGHLGVWSFEAKKHVATGEGGMVTTKGHGRRGRFEREFMQEVAVSPNSTSVQHLVARKRLPIGFEVAPASRDRVGKCRLESFSFPHPATYLGKGKIEELRQRAIDTDASLIGNW